MSFVLGAFRMAIHCSNHNATRSLYVKYVLVINKLNDCKNLKILKNMSTIRIIKYNYSKSILDSTHEAGTFYYSINFEDMGKNKHPSEF